ncbi:radical SAM/SPASM domain-containing protein [Candidatus Latescibacterota bacterium]
MRSRLPLKLFMKTVIRYPDLTSILLRGMARKHIGINRDYRHGTGKALKKPYQISLRITNVCNHRCAVCGQYGRHGYMKVKDSRHLLKTLPVETYKDLVDQVAYYKPIFYVTGGEPFLYPGFIELMNYIKMKGCVLSVVTNGVLLEKYAEEIVKNKWDMILISFDGPEEIHDRCRNFPGAYDTAVRGLLKLNEMKERYKSAKPFVLTSTTISEVNAPHLNKTFEIISELEPDLLVLYLSWFTSEAIGKAQTKLLEEHMSMKPFTWRSYATEFSEETAGLFQKAVIGVKKKKLPLEYLIIPALKDRDIARYYTETSEMFGYSKCVAPFLMIDVMPNGDVTTCRDFIDVKVGNITEKSILKIWNDEPFVRFRKLLIDKGGLLPQCSRCCGLMGF